MSRHSRTSFAFVLIPFLAAEGAAALTAQESGLARAVPGRTLSCESLDDDSPYPLGYERTLELAILAVHIGRIEPEKEDRKCFFRMAEALARHLVFENPNDPDPRYWYSAAMGLRADEEGGHTQLGLAKRAHDQSRLTLSVAPDHAGAQHVLGRVHAAVMRLSGFKRFLATRVLGAASLSEASWETAESFLAAAARLQPEVPDHHYELGRLYLDTDRPQLALASFERVLTCPPTHPGDRAVRVRAREMVERLRRELAG